MRRSSRNGPSEPLFRFVEEKPTLHGKRRSIQIFAKVGEHLWVRGSGRDEASVLANINEVLPKPFSYGWPKNDAGVRFDLDFARNYHKLGIDESLAVITPRKR